MSSLVFMFMYVWSKVHKLHVKLQSGISWDLSSRSWSIGNLWRTSEDSFWSFLHQKEPIVPAFDDSSSTNSKFKWLSSIQAWVEFCSIKQGASVVSFNFCTGCHCWTFSFLVDLNAEFSFVDCFSNFLIQSIQLLIILFLTRFFFFRRLWAFKIYKLDIKLQCGIRWNWSHSSLAISNVRWAIEYSFRSFLHLKEPIIPTFDDLTDSNDKVKRLTSISARIELRSI